MSHQTLFLNDQLYDYLKANSLREHAVLQELRAVTSELSTSVMQIAPEQGQFMVLLIELLGAKKTIELGVYTGYSALTTALALPNDGKVLACDINAEWTQLAREFWQKAGVEHKIELRLQPATEFLQQLLDEGQQDQFDFVFIDADKANYPTYYEESLKLIRPGGLIVIDNVFLAGDVADTTDAAERTHVMRELNLKVLNDDRVSISMLPIGDGLTLARKR